jgi:hypothetical protein
MASLGKAQCLDDTSPPDKRIPFVKKEPPGERSFYRAMEPLQHRSLPRRTATTTWSPRAAQLSRKNSMITESCLLTAQKPGRGEGDAPPSHAVDGGIGPTSAIASQSRDAPSCRPGMWLERNPGELQAPGGHRDYPGIPRGLPGRCQDGLARLAPWLGGRRHLQDGAHSTMTAFTPSAEGRSQARMKL